MRNSIHSNVVEDTNSNKTRIRLFHGFFKLIEYVNIHYSAAVMMKDKKREIKRYEQNPGSLFIL